MKKLMIVMFFAALCNIASGQPVGGLVVKGSANQSVVIRIIDATAFTPETGVEFDTSGIDLWYRREGTSTPSAPVDITETALAAITTAHADGGIEHINDGYYRLDLPDAAWLAGADAVAIGGTITGMIVEGGISRIVSSPGYIHNDRHVFYVSKNDVGYGTIAAAITASASGDTIQIAPGTYAEAVDLPTAAKTLSLIGMGTRDQVLINPASGTAVIMADYCSLENLTAKGDVGINAQGTTQPRFKNVIGWGTALAGSIDGLQANTTVGLYAEDCYFKATWDGAVCNGAIGANFLRCVFETLGTYPGVTQYALKGPDGTFTECILIFQNRATATTDPKVGTNGSSQAVFVRCTVNIRSYASIFDDVAADVWCIEGPGTYLDCFLRGQADTGGGQSDWVIKNGGGSSLVLDNTKFGWSQNVTGTYLKKPVGDMSGRVDIGLVTGTSVTNIADFKDSGYGTTHPTPATPTITIPSI